VSEIGEQDNYATPDNLLARIAIHRYATDPGWTKWLFDRETPDRREAACILDVGCGTASLWTANRQRNSSDWDLTLVDSSAGMINAARHDLGALAAYVVADAQTLPFEDCSFDLVLANRMLYHVPDRPAAFTEIRRVLRPGGRFHCSTNGRGHLAQLAALLPDSVTITTHGETFGLETGPPQLEPFFTQISVERFESSLRVPAAEPVLAYIASSERYSQSADLDAARKIVEAEIQRAGAFSIETHPGVISSRRS
jgi:SAM-dependent methyltransferase